MKGDSAPTDQQDASGASPLTWTIGLVILAGFILFAAVAVAVYGRIAGGVLTPFRLYVTGEFVDAKVLACHKALWIEPNTGVTGYSYSVEVDYEDGSFPITFCDDSLVGASVGLLFSEAAQAGAVPHERTLWSILKVSYGASTAGVVLLALVIGGITLFRVFKHAHFVKGEIVNRLRNIAAREQERISRCVEYARLTTDVLVLVLVHIALLILIVRILQALLYVETDNLYFFNALSLAFFVTVWSPASLHLTSLLWRLYGSNLVHIIRNFLAGGAVITAIVNLSQIAAGQRGGVFESVGAAFKCVALAMVGLDPTECHR